MSQISPCCVFVFSWYPVPFIKLNCIQYEKFHSGEPQLLELFQQTLKSEVEPIQEFNTLNRVTCWWFNCKLVEARLLSARLHLPIASPDGGSPTPKLDAIRSAVTDHKSEIYLCFLDPKWAPPSSKYLLGQVYDFLQGKQIKIQQQTFVVSKINSCNQLP